MKPLLIACIICVSSLVNANEEPLEAARKAWIERALIIKSFRVEWTQSQKLPNLDEEVEQLKKEGTKILTNYSGAMIQQKQVLTMDGKKFVLIIKSLPGSRKQIDSKTVSDGDTVKVFGRIVNGDKKHEQGSITNEPLPNRSTPDFFAIMSHLRTENAQYSPIPSEKIQVVEELKQEDGKSKYLFTDHAEKNRRTIEMVVNPADRWTVERLDRFSHGIIQSRLTIDYAATGLIGSLPDDWSFVSYKDGTPLSETVGKFEKWELNPKIDEKEFQLEFPPGAVIGDIRTKEIKKVEPDGSLKTIE